MKELKTLVGDDSMIFFGGLSETEFAGDGDKTIGQLASGQSVPADLRRIMCVITAIAADSLFPEGFAVGDLFPALGSEVPEEGDKFRVLTLTHAADASSWSLSITQSEIDVTRLNDKYHKYRLGKKDAQLALSSIFTVGESDKQGGGIINRSMKLVSQASDGTYTVSDEANQALYMLGYVNKASLPSEADDFVFCQIYLYNVKLGGQSGSAQSYDASGRLTGRDPVFYSLEAQHAA